MTEIPQVNLVAVVGRGGAIGPADGPPMLTHEDEAEWFQEWFWDLTEDGIIVLGGRAFRWLTDQSPPISSKHTIVAWSRSNSHAAHTGKTGLLTPDDFLGALKDADKPIFICGGLNTYRTFMPYVTQFFIRRVAINTPHDNYMPPLFGRSQ